MNQHIDLRDLRLIRRLADNGSITAAARQLHVTQSAASQRLASLQRRFELPLFERTDDGFAITAAGQVLYAAAQRIDQTLFQAFEQLHRLGAEGHGRLRVTTQCYTCYRWLPAVIASVQQRLPQMEIEVVAEATDEPYQALRGDRIDLAIVSDEALPEGYDYAPLFDDEFYAVLANDHPLAGQQSVDPVDFAEQNVIVYSGRRHAIVERVLAPAGVTPRKLTQVRITEAIVELARAGVGIAVLAGWAFADLPDRSGLRALRIGRHGFRRRWHAATRRGYQSLGQQSVISSLQQVGAQLGLGDWRQQLGLGDWRQQLRCA